MIRACLVAAALLWSAPAYAFPCWMVRKAVAQYGAETVESWAKARGVSEKDIENIFVNNPARAYAFTSTQNKSKERSSARYA